MSAGLLFMGIDPGVSGALAVLNADGRLVDLARMPTEPHGKARRVSGRDLRAFIEGAGEASGCTVGLCMLEQVASRPGQGAPSIFTFGRAFGAVEAVLSALAVPTDYATPQAWKRAYGLGSDKAESIRKAIDLIPGLAAWPTPSSRLTHDQAEAVLLAEFARRRWHGQH
jgi:crossover junction endodeoxyribonuclease RuvC